MSMKKMKFNKKEHWDTCKFYQIYMKDDVKMIKFIGITDRESQGKGYLAWICTTCFNCEMYLEDFLEWDIYYQYTKLMERCRNYIVEGEHEPQDAFDKANYWVRAKGEGSYNKNLLDLTEDTPCGYYYGN